MLYQEPNCLMWGRRCGHRRDGGRIVAIECKLKERPDIADSAGLRALDEAEKGRIKNKFVVCRTKVSYKLSDGIWVVNLSELLRSLKAR